MINKISSVAERAIWAIDTFIDRAVLVAWTSTLRHHVNVDGGSNLDSLPRADEHTPEGHMLNS